MKLPICPDICPGLVQHWTVSCDEVSVSEMPTWVNKNMGGKVFKKGRNFGIPKSM